MIWINDRTSVADITVTVRSIPTSKSSELPERRDPLPGAYGAGTPAEGLGRGIPE